MAYAGDANTAEDGSNSEIDVAGRRELPELGQVIDQQVGSLRRARQCPLALRSLEGVPWNMGVHLQASGEAL